MRQCVRSIFFVLVGLALCAAVPGAAAASEWDQAAVTELAKQLADAAGNVRQSVRRAPPPGPGTSQRRLHFQALDDLRVLQNSINSLARQLEAGVGREETFPTFRRIRTLSNDIAQIAQRADIREPTLGKLQTAAGVLGELAPFYAPEEAS